MAVCSCMTMSDSKFSSFLRRIRQKVHRSSSSASASAPSNSPPKDLEKSPSKLTISSPTAFYQDNSRDAAISMSKLTEDHSSYVQSIKSDTRPSSKAASIDGDSCQELSQSEMLRTDPEMLKAKSEMRETALVIVKPNNLADSLQLKGPRVSTMFKGMPWLQLQGDVDEEKEKLQQSKVKRMSIFGQRG